MKIRRSMLSLFLSLSIVFTFMPAMAFADIENEDDGVQIEEKLDNQASEDVVETETAAEESEADEDASDVSEDKASAGEAGAESSEPTDAPAIKEKKELLWLPQKSICSWRWILITT